jgi:selT/selW/selH-like putative selenoprotein
MTPTVAIEFCVVRNSYPRAAGLADSIEQRFGFRPQLVKGARGAFEVTVGNELIFSKKTQGRFPGPGEIEEVLAGRIV